MGTRVPRLLSLARALVLVQPARAQPPAGFAFSLMACLLLFGRSTSAQPAPAQPAPAPTSGTLADIAAKLDYVLADFGLPCPDALYFEGAVTERFGFWARKLARCSRTMP